MSDKVICMLLLGKLQEYSFEITHEEVAHRGT